MLILECPLKPSATGIITIFPSNGGRVTVPKSNHPRLRRVFFIIFFLPMNFIETLPVENAEARRLAVGEALKTDDVTAITQAIQQTYDCSGNEAAAICDILSIGKNKKNPTVDALIIGMINSLRTETPVQFWVSQCIGKASEVRLHKLDYFCKPDSEKPRNVELSDCVALGLESKCWPELRRMQNAVRSNITILLGDQDFFTLDAMDEWASEDSITRLQKDLDALFSNTQKMAKEYFGLESSVVRWTMLYDKAQFLEELDKAKVAKELWLSGKFKRGSIRPYMTSWGYPAIAKDRGISEQALSEFIENDIVRTAAQYRIESRIAAQRSVVQCWAETCGDPLWPIAISNYDKQGVPASIPLL